MKNITSMNRRFFISSAIIGAGAMVVGCSSNQGSPGQANATPDTQNTNEKTVIHTFPIVSTDQVELGSKETDTSGDEYQAETYNNRYHRHDTGGWQFLNIDASAKAYRVASHLGAEYDTDREAFKNSYFFRASEHQPISTDSLSHPAEIENIAWANAYDTDGTMSQTAQIFFQPLGSVVLHNLAFDPRTNTAIIATYVIEDRFITDSFDKTVADYAIMDSGTMNGMQLRTPPTFRVVAGAGQLREDGSFEQYVVTTARYVNGTLPV